MRQPQGRLELAQSNITTVHNIQYLVW